ncbi:MAG TPA: hypothetical protein VFV65_01270 [Gemmatimonadales bacterium]|nr:hypothetical protein [Gemmatimonadales bacterium]
MRVSGTRLLHSAIRLSDVAFPAADTLLARTRLIYVHLDNLLSFAKRDRDGKVDAYFLGYLPDELILLFFRQGELVTAAGIGAGRRSVLPIAEAVRRLKADPERGEAAYCAAPMAQLELMYQACAAPAEPWVVDSKHPERVFPRVAEESLTGALEIISNGRVNYLQFEAGKFRSGFFYARPDHVPLPAYIEGLFQPGPDGVQPALAVSGVPPVAGLPAQVLPSQVRMYRELFQRIAGAVQQELPEDGMRRVDRVTTRLLPERAALANLLPSNGGDPSMVATPAADLTSDLAAWTGALLTELEVVSPGCGPRILQDATRDQRHLLQAAGFYAHFPWSLTW